MPLLCVILREDDDGYLPDEVPDYDLNLAQRGRLYSEVEGNNYI